MQSRIPIVDAFMPLTDLICKEIVGKSEGPGVRPTAQKVADRPGLLAASAAKRRPPQHAKAQAASNAGQAQKLKAD